MGLVLKLLTSNGGEKRTSWEWRVFLKTMHTSLTLIEPLLLDINR